MERFAASIVVATLILAGCGQSGPSDTGLQMPDQGARQSDAGLPDSSLADAVTDGAAVDRGVDTGVADTGTVDSGVADTGVADTGTLDSGVADTGIGRDAEPGPIDGGPSWTLVRMPIPRLSDGGQIATLPLYAGGINEDRFAVGTAHDIRGNGIPFVFALNQSTALPISAGHTGGIALGINAGGAVSGYLKDPHGQRVPVQWARGAVEDLGRLARFPDVRALAIANDGTLLLQAYTSTSAGTSTAARTFVGMRGAFRNISPSGFRYSVGVSMSKQGVVAGYASNDTLGGLLVSSQGFVHDSATQTTTLLAPLPGDTDTIADCVTRRGRIIGFSYNLSTQSVVLFDLHGGGLILRSEPNGPGHTIGNDEFVLEDYGEFAAPQIYLGGRWYPLARLVPNIGAFAIDNITDVNDRGDMAGDGHEANGDMVAFVLYRR